MALPPNRLFNLAKSLAQFASSNEYISKGKLWKLKSSDHLVNLLLSKAPDEADKIKVIYIAWFLLNRPKMKGSDIMNIINNLYVVTVDFYDETGTIKVDCDNCDYGSVDCSSCDSDFMMSVMDDVGKSIRDAYSRVPPEDVIYLGMDNAGGHGKKDIIKEYEQLLKNKYNIIILWQQPRTPESNMLDLGIWMHLQSLVEEKHFGKRVHAESLWKTMQSAWDLISAQALTNVYARWIKVLDLIIEGEGSSHLVEKKRGRFFSVPSDEAEVFDGAEDGDVDGSDVEGEDEDDGEEAWCDL